MRRWVYVLGVAWACHLAGCSDGRGTSVPSAADGAECHRGDGGTPVRGAVVSRPAAVQPVPKAGARLCPLPRIFRRTCRSTAHGSGLCGPRTAVRLTAGTVQCFDSRTLRCSRVISSVRWSKGSVAVLPDHCGPAAPAGSRLRAAAGVRSRLGAPLGLRHARGLAWHLSTRRLMASQLALQPGEVSRAELAPPARRGGRCHANPRAFTGNGGVART